MRSREYYLVLGLLSPLRTDLGPGCPPPPPASVVLDESQEGEEEGEEGEGRVGVITAAPEASLAWLGRAGLETQRGGDHLANTGGQIDQGLPQIGQEQREIFLGLGHGDGR